MARSTSYRPSRCNLGQLDTKSLRPAGLLGFKIPVGRNLISQLVLLNTAGVAAGLGRACSVRLDCVVEFFFHVSVPVRWPDIGYLCRIHMDVSKNAKNYRGTQAIVADVELGIAGLCSYVVMRLLQWRHSRWRNIRLPNARRV